MSKIREVEKETLNSILILSLTTAYFAKFNSVQLCTIKERVFLSSKKVVDCRKNLSILDQNDMVRKVNTSNRKKVCYKKVRL